LCAGYFFLSSGVRAVRTCAPISLVVTSC
jgi:hypothetical protein